MKKRYIFIGISVVVILGIIIFCFLEKNKEIAQYETKPLKKCTITQIVEASGTINPVNTVSVGSTVSGLIKEIYVDFNSEVKKGQILAQIDPANFEAAVSQQSAAIVNAQSNLAKLYAVAEMDKKTYDRYSRLYKKNFIAKSELDQAQSDYQADLAQINAAKSQIIQAQAQYKTAVTNLGYTKIIAPVNGTIISRKIDLGQPVAASFQAPELFTIAQDLTKMQIEVNVSEADIGKVKNGQDVTYTLDGYPDDVFKGKVTQVRISPTTVSNVVTYSVIVAVENEDLKLKPGMTANVSIIVDKSENILCVPNKALKFTPVKSADKMVKYQNQGLWVLDKKPERVDIKTGASDESVTEVICDKLKAGQKVIVGFKSDKNKKKSSGARPLM